MAITATPTYGGYVWEGNGSSLRIAKLAVAGLTAAANNTVPHGLPAAPKYYFYGAQPLGWSEQAVPDATNIYIAVATAGATSGTVVVLY